MIEFRVYGEPIPQGYRERRRARGEAGQAGQARSSWRPVPTVSSDPDTWARVTAAPGERVHEEGGRPGEKSPPVEP